MFRDDFGAESNFRALHITWWWQSVCTLCTSRYVILVYLIDVGIKISLQKPGIISFFAAVVVYFASRVPTHLTKDGRQNEKKIESVFHSKIGFWFYVAVCTQDEFVVRRTKGMTNSVVFEPGFFSLVSYPDINNATNTIKKVYAGKTYRSCISWLQKLVLWWQMRLIAAQIH